MKASEIIKILTEYVEKYGDLEVRHHTGGRESKVWSVDAYDENGWDEGSEKHERPIVEFFIH